MTPQSESKAGEHVGDTPWKVRLNDWWRRKLYTWRDRDWGPWLTGRVRWFLSYYLGIGQWFRDAKDKCHHCGALPSDIDYEIRRVGPRKAECWDRGLCDEAIRENQEALS